MVLSPLPSRVVVAHSAVDASADPSTADVLDQVSLVEQALADLGLTSERAAVREGRVWEALHQRPGDLVFALLEAPPGRPQLQTAATAALELLGVRFTGTASGPMWLTTDKLATRAVLADAGLPVAAGGRWTPDGAVLERVEPPWILKPAWEDASVGLDGSPVAATAEQARARAASLARRFPGQPVLVEHFLPGRELNVALLGGPGGPEALPVAEIEFVGFPAGVPALVGYEAKWLAGSFEDIHTVRCFPDEGAEARLLAEARRLALAAWEVTGLAGYARVDLRLDEAGHAYILEVNANPCLSAEAGFMAAAGHAGLSAAAVVGRIIAAALH